MTDPTPTRKSARGRVPNRKYSIDAFEGLDLLSSDSEANAQGLLPQLDDTDEDQDFTADKAAEELDAAEGSDTIAENTSDESGAVTPTEEYEDALSYTSDVEAIETGGGLHEETTLKSLTSRGPKDKNLPKSDIHSRGVLDPHVYQGKGVNLKHLFGTNPNDLLNPMQSRDKWAGDSTFPTREANEYGSGGIDYPFAHSRESRQAEANEQWKWYYGHRGKFFIVEKQNMKALSSNEVAKYFPAYSKPSHSFLMGPYGRQQLHTLALNRYIFLNQAWSCSSSDAPKIAEDVASHRRSGWILNLGAKVRCLDWAPNHNGIIQYLAITVTDIPRLSNPPNSAFAPSEQFPACVQIWAFTACKVLGYEDFFDSEKPPQLVHVICTEWGSVRQLRWCPITRESPDENAHDKTSIGLLAGIWSDGCVRVLDVYLDKIRNSSSIYGR